MDLLLSTSLARQTVFKIIQYRVGLLKEAGPLL